MRLITLVSLAVFATGATIALLQTRAQVLTLATVFLIAGAIIEWWIMRKRFPPEAADRMLLWVGLALAWSSVA